MLLTLALVPLIPLIPLILLILFILLMLLVARGVKGSIILVTKTSDQTRQRGHTFSAVLKKALRPCVSFDCRVQPAGAGTGIVQARRATGTSFFLVGVLW